MAHAKWQFGNRSSSEARGSDRHDSEDLSGRWSSLTSASSLLAQSQQLSSGRTSRQSVMQKTQPGSSFRTGSIP